MPTVVESRLVHHFDEVKCDILSKNQEAENALKLEEISRTFMFPTMHMNKYAFRASLGNGVYVDGSTAALEAHVKAITTYRWTEVATTNGRV